MRDFCINFEMELQVAQIGSQPIAVDGLRNRSSNVKNLHHRFELILLYASIVVNVLNS
jgi:hypothetical protein